MVTLIINVTVMMINMITEITITIKITVQSSSDNSNVNNSTTHVTIKRQTISNEKTLILNRSDI